MVPGQWKQGSRKRAFESQSPGPEARCSLACIPAVGISATPSLPHGLKPSESVTQYKHFLSSDVLPGILFIATTQKRLTHVLGPVNSQYL